HGRHPADGPGPHPPPGGTQSRPDRRRRHRPRGGRPAGGLRHHARAGRDPRGRAVDPGLRDDHPGHRSGGHVLHAHGRHGREGGTGMITAIRAELLKIRTTPLAAALLALAAGLNGLVAAVTAARAGSGGSLTVPPLDTTAGLRMVLTSGGFGPLPAPGLRAPGARGGFPHSRPPPPPAPPPARPSRARVLAARAAAAAAAGLVLGLAATAVTTGTGLVFATARGYPLALPAATITRYAAGVIVASGLLAAIGVGVGSLIRNQIGAVIAVLFWAFGIEQIIGALSRTTTAYLPYTAAATLAGARGGNGMPQVPVGLTPLPAGARRPPPRRPRLPPPARRRLPPLTTHPPPPPPTPNPATSGADRTPPPRPGACGTGADAAARERGHRQPRRDFPGAPIRQAVPSRSVTNMIVPVRARPGRRADAPLPTIGPAASCRCLVAVFKARHPGCQVTLQEVPVT